MLYLIVEEKYRSYPWCQRALQGLREELRKKKLDIYEITDTAQLPGNAEKSAILLLGASESWVQCHAYQANNRGVHPILLSNRMPTPLEMSFSLVTMDIHDSICKAIGYLQSLGCKNLALYGCNRQATSDPWREQAFRAILGENAKVFYNQESLEQTFEGFWENRTMFDGVICANDYAALSLVRRLEQRGVGLPEELYIVGCGDLFLSRISTPSITSVSDDYEHFGRAAISIYNLIIKEETISTVTIQLHSQLHPRMTTGNLPYHPGSITNTVKPTGDNPFFSDTEVSEMVKLEMLLNQCDLADMEVIHCLLDQMSYAAIAEHCFICETAVKYRVKKMESICGVNNRKLLIDFLKRFF